MLYRFDTQAGLSMDPLDPIPLEDEYTFTPAGAPGASGVPGAAHTATFYAFNTVVTLQAWDAEGVHPEAGTELARSAFQSALADCRTFERLFSRTLSHSDISRLNAAQGAWTPIADATFDLLGESIRYCRESHGTFDITIGAATRLWDFHRSVIPDPAELAEALHHVDFRMIELTGEAGLRMARLADPAGAVDVGGTAKGFIADALRERLFACGLRHFLINLGGNVMVCGGKPDGSPFRVGIKDPKNPSAILGAIPITDGSVVTSGLYERAFERDGVRFSHILSPETGFPIATDAESVTVVAARSADCDGYSTTLCALGIDEGLAFARTHPELASVIFVDADNKLHMQSACSA